MCHPPLERLGFGLAGTQNEGIQAGFGDETERPAAPSRFRNYGVHGKMSFLHHGIKANISSNDVGSNGRLFIKNRRGDPCLQAGVVDAVSFSS